MNCLFCRSDTGLSKVKLQGRADKKKKQKTCFICSTCSAWADSTWIEEHLGWDEGTLKRVSIK